MDIVLFLFVVVCMRVIARDNLIARTLSRRSFSVLFRIINIYFCVLCLSLLIDYLMFYMFLLLLCMFVCCLCLFY